MAPGILPVVSWMVRVWLVEGGRQKVDIEMFNSLEEEVMLSKSTHSALVHPVEVKKVRDEEKRTSGECVAWKVSKREPLPEELQRVWEEAQFDLTREELTQISQLLYLD